MGRKGRAARETHRTKKQKPVRRRDAQRTLMAYNRFMPWCVKPCTLDDFETAILPSVL